MEKNSIDNTQPDNKPIHDEIVDHIPESVKNVNEEKKAYTYYSDKTTAESSLTGVLSLALGIFSVICCCTFIPSAISAAIGLILGIITLMRKNNENKLLPVIGIILCLIGLAIFLVTFASAIIFGSIQGGFEIPATMHSMTM